MRAAFCTGPRTIELRDVATPQIDADQVLVQVHACGICGSDLHYYGGEASPPPVCLGHEISGRLLTPAPGLAAGTAVAVEPLIPCGSCERCEAGEPNLCPALRILGTMAPGGLAETVAVPSAALYALPVTVDLDTAMLTEPLAVAVHAAHLAAIEPDQEVLVLGAGAIGLLAAFAAHCRGGRVTLTARHPHQAAAGSALGIDRVIEATAEAVRAAGQSRRPDVVLETVGGHADTLDQAIALVRPGGRIVTLGVFTRPIILDPIRFLMKEIHLRASMTYCRSPRPDFLTALGLLAEHGRRLSQLITHRVPLAEVSRGFAIAADKSSGAIKVAIDVVRR